MPLIWSDAFLTEEQKMVAESAREFAEKEIKPIAAKVDREHMFPKDVIKKLGELGFMGMLIPTEWGGAGMDSVSYTAAMEEISVACASTAVIMSVNNSLVCQALLDFGTPAQKEKFLKPLAQGKKLGCYCLSETSSASDSANMKMKAEQKGDHWVLNGVKNWITNANEADIAIVFAQTDSSLKHKGIAAFIVERTSPGYTVAKAEEKLGICGSSTHQIVFENVKVHQDQVLGKVGEGFPIAMKILDGGRIGIACQAVGIARASLEHALGYALEREAFGKPIIELGAIQIHLAEMATQIDAARMLIRQAAHLKDVGKPYSRYAAEAKLFASETAGQVTTRGIQILGGYGYTKEYPQERHFRDAKITEIYEGTSEIQRVVIARNLGREAQQ